MTQVNAGEIIQRLGDQLGAMTVELVVKDLTIEALQAELAARDAALAAESSGVRAKETEAEATYTDGPAEDARSGAN